MKKLVAFVLLFSVMALSLFGCNATPKCFTGEWKYSSIVSVELRTDLYTGELDNLKQEFNAEDEEGVVANALNSFATNETFSAFYLRFDRKFAYTNDILMEREATWAVYVLNETDAFISIYTELDASNGNPYPDINPDLKYNAETETMLITMDYRSFMVTLKLTR